MCNNGHFVFWKIPGNESQTYKALLQPATAEKKKKKSAEEKLRMKLPGSSEMSSSRPSGWLGSCEEMIRSLATIHEDIYMIIHVYDMGKMKEISRDRVYIVILVYFWGSTICQTDKATISRTPPWCESYWRMFQPRLMTAEGVCRWHHSHVKLPSIPINWLTHHW